MGSVLLAEKMGAQTKKKKINFFFLRSENCTKIGGGQNRERRRRKIEGRGRNRKEEENLGSDERASNAREAERAREAVSSTRLNNTVLLESITKRVSAVLIRMGRII